MRGLWYLLAAVVVGLALPAAAPAQSAALQAQTPDGRTVTLNVRDGSGLRCFSHAIGDEPFRRTSPCAARPAGADADALALRVVYRDSPEKLAIIYGSLSGRTAELRVTLADGRQEVLRPQRTSGAYLHVVSGRPRIGAVRAYDRAGRLRGAAYFDARAARTARGPFTLFGTSNERGRRALVTAFTAWLYRDGSTRRARHACMAVTATRDVPAPGAEPGYSGGFACTTSRRRIVVRYADFCATERLLLYGIAPSVVHRFTLITASGLRLPVKMASFPRRMGTRGRAFVISRPHVGPLARLEGYRRNGDRIVSVALSGAGSGCGSSSRS